MKRSKKVTPEQREILADWTMNYIKNQGKTDPKYFERL